MIITKYLQPMENLSKVNMVLRMEIKPKVVAEVLRKEVVANGVSIGEVLTNQKVLTKIQFATNVMLNKDGHALISEDELGEISYRILQGKL